MSLNRFFNACVALVSRDFNAELARRDARRGKTPYLWFTPEEAVVAEALSKIIVPSDENSPGIDEISVLGENAITLLDKMVAESPGIQQFYSQGLLAFDCWAGKEYARPFVELSTAEQESLFRAAHEEYDRSRAQTSLFSRVRRGFDAIVHAGKGTFHAARFCPIIRDDCLQIFYTSRVSWTWLDYDGPPMDMGYPNLVRRR
jgi:hypothetical protein